MASRPLKRQKRHTELSINERGLAPCETPRKRKTTDNKRVNEVNRASSKKVLTSSRSSRGIPSFFNSVTSSQTSPSSESRTVNQGRRNLEVENDDIEDDAPSKADTTVSQKTRLPTSFSSSSQLFSSKTHKQAATKYNEESRKFLNIPMIADSNVSGTTNPATNDDQCESWADVLGPDGINELAVNPKKIAALSAWLLEATNDDKSRKALLIVKGPPGCGKSTAVRMIALSLGIRLLEWHNPIGSIFGSEGFVSLANQFEEFLNRGLQYAALETVTGEDRVPSHIRDASQTTSKRKEALIIEDIPNVFSQDSTTLTAFRNSLLRFITARSMKQSHQEGVYRQVDLNVPIVLIFSETPRTSGSMGSELLTAGRLLGQEILRHVSTSIVEINPVASAAMKKALNLIIKKRARRYNSSWTPQPSLLQNIIQAGDIRNAIGNLELLCKSTGSSRTEDYQGSGTDQRPFQNNHLNNFSGPIYNVEIRESSVDFFHAVAKVMYNKRKTGNQISGAITQHISQPPSYLARHVRLTPSEVSSQQLFNTMDADIETFIAALHENYLASCAGSDFIRTFDACAEGLSTVDTLKLASGFSMRSNRISKHNYFGLENLDSSRLNELAFHAAVHGLLFVLPSPVNRAASVSVGMKSARDPFKMVYPTLYKLSRQIEEAEEALALCSRAIEETSPGRNWPLKDQFSPNEPPEVQRTRLPEGRSAPCFPCSRMNRAEMILEYLPYLNLLLPRLPQRNEFQGVASLVSLSTSSVEPAYGLDPMIEEMAPISNRQGDLHLKPRHLSPSKLSHVNTMRFSKPPPLEWEQLFLSEDDIDTA